jgi:hypothetical protein
MRKRFASRLVLLAIAGALAALLAAPVAQAAPKPKIKAKEWCRVINGQLYSGILVSGKHFPADRPINTYVRAYLPSGDQVPTEGGLVVADSKGRWTGGFSTFNPLASITYGAVSFLVEPQTPVEVTVESPCQ